MGFKKKKKNIKMHINIQKILYLFINLKKKMHPFLSEHSKKNETLQLYVNPLPGAKIL